VVRRDGTFQYWFTISERSYDKRTGASAEISEDMSGRWSWRVTHSAGQERGSTSSQKAARAAVRRYVRGLDSKPDRQLHLFNK